LEVGKPVEEARSLPVTAIPELWLAVDVAPNRTVDLAEARQSTRGLEMVAELQTIVVVIAAPGPDADRPGRRSDVVLRDSISKQWTRKPIVFYYRRPARGVVVDHVDIRKQLALDVPMLEIPRQTVAAEPLLGIDEVKGFVVLVRFRNIVEDPAPLEPTLAPVIRAAVEGVEEQPVAGIRDPAVPAFRAAPPATPAHIDNALVPGGRRGLESQDLSHVVGKDDLDRGSDGESGRVGLRSDLSRRHRCHQHGGCDHAAHPYSKLAHRSQVLKDNTSPSDGFGADDAYKLSDARS
jgi:hypothetical protein